MRRTIACHVQQQSHTHTESNAAEWKISMTSLYCHLHDHIEIYDHTHSDYHILTTNLFMPSFIIFYMYGMKQQNSKRFNRNFIQFISHGYNVIQSKRFFCLEFIISAWECDGNDAFKFIYVQFFKLNHFGNKLFRILLANFLFLNCTFACHLFSYLSQTII